MRNLQKEFMVGCLVLTVVILMGVFAWLLGVLEPFSNSVRYHLLYGFAGGIEVGSAVRVAGIKVGKVDKIEFLAESSKAEKDPVALKITVSVSKAASPSVRKNSKFYVNMAGVIGERYVEISPGTLEATPLPPGSMIRGVDPPRIDQLLSQGYGLFGKIQDFVIKNEDAMTEFLDSLSAMLKRKDWKKFLSLIDNINAVTSDLRVVTKRFRSKESDEVFDKVYEMLNRAYEIDKATLKKFLQDEGIRARIF